MRGISSQPGTGMGEGRTERDRTPRAACRAARRRRRVPALAGPAVACPRGLDPDAGACRRAAERVAPDGRRAARHARERAQRRLSPARDVLPREPRRPRARRGRLRARLHGGRRQGRALERARLRTGDDEPRRARLGAGAVPPHGAARPAPVDDGLLGRIRDRLHGRLEDQQRRPHGRPDRLHVPRQRPARHPDDLLVQRGPQPVRRRPWQRRPHTDRLQHLGAVQRPVEQDQRRVRDARRADAGRRASRAGDRGQRQRRPARGVPDDPRAAARSRRDVRRGGERHRRRDRRRRDDRRSSVRPVVGLLDPRRRARGVAEGHRRARHASVDLRPAGPAQQRGASRSHQPAQQAGRRSCA